MLVIIIFVVDVQSFLSDNLHKTLEYSISMVLCGGVQQLAFYKSVICNYK